MKNDFFTYAAYKKFMLHIKANTEFVLFQNALETERGVLLRHDIDFDLKAAQAIFTIEMNNNIQSTYFVMVTSDTYNIQNRVSRDIIKRLNKEGNEIGLHFDSTIYDDTIDIHYAIQNETKVINDIIGKEVRSISLHQPTDSLIFHSYVNAYDKKIFNDDIYLSDSCMDFRGKKPFDFINRNRERLVQVSLHPCHFSLHATGYIGVAKRIMFNMITNLHLGMFTNNAYKESIKGKTLHDYI